MWCPDTCPAILLAAILAMLGKPEGSFRPIALLPTPTRVFSRLSRGGIKLRGRANDRGYLYGVHGKSCERAVWGQSLTVEQRVSVGGCSGSCLVDFVKACEKVCHYLLAVAAVKHTSNLMKLR
eukprot:1671098-Pyramimonas_sp.AAC.1